MPSVHSRGTGRHGQEQALGVMRKAHVVNGIQQGLHGNPNTGNEGNFLIIWKCPRRGGEHNGPAHRKIGVNTFDDGRAGGRI